MSLRFQFTLLIFMTLLVSCTEEEIVKVEIAPSDKIQLAYISAQDIEEGDSLALSLSAGSNTFRGEQIIYSCSYDTSFDNYVSDSAPGCTFNGISFSSTNGQLSWVPDYSQSGVYEVRVSASAKGESTSKIFVITVDHKDAPPQLSGESSQTVNELDPITTIDINDGVDDLTLDAAAITYSCYYDLNSIDGIVLPVNDCSTLVGATFNTATGVFDWTPDALAGDTDPGLYEFNITGTAAAGNDDVYFTIVVNNLTGLSLDAIADETVAENAAITTVDAGDGGDDIALSGMDIDYTCTFNGGTACTSLPGAVTFDTANGVLDWTPDYSAAATGVFNIIITGSDGVSSDTENLAITVNNSNRAPVLDAIGDETVAENAAITSIDAGDGADDQDIDSETLTYTCTFNGGTACTSLPGVESWTAATGALTWTPDYTAAATGTFNFTITGSDGSLSDTETFTITVTNTNRAPVLDAIGDETVAENAAITSIDAGDGADDQDVDAETISYTCTFNGGTACTSLPGVESWTAATGVLAWTPDYTAAATGTFNFTITGSDGSLSDTETFTITVTNTNQAPVLDVIGDETVAENAAITSIDAGDGADDSDADGETISYTCTFNGGTACTSLPGVESWTAATGVLTWTPDYTAAATGTFNFTITGSDGSLSDTETFTITVTNTDQAPSLAAITDETVDENVAITTVDANDGGDDSDADGDTITYACYYDKNSVDGSVASTNTCASLGATFNTTTGVLDWTPSYSDGDGASDQYEFRITGDANALTSDAIFVITVDDVFKLGFYKIVRGSTGGCGLTSEGIAYCWGRDNYGQSGNGDTSVDLSPIPVVTTLRFTDIGMGWAHTCGLTNEGDIYCWGNGANGKLGNGATTDSLIPVLVDMSGHGTDNKFKQLGKIAYDHSCGISIEGNIYCWGYGLLGELGNGSSASQSTPVKVNFSAFSSDLRMTKVVTGRNHTCALSDEGQVYCWGYNGQYTLGDGTATSSNTPILVNITTSRFKDLTAYHYGNCGLKIDGTVECWGQGNKGQIGDNSGAGTTTATGVVDMTNLGANEIFRSISGGGYHVCGITNLGNLYCWGDSARVGDGSTSGNTLRPVATDMSAFASDNKFMEVTSGESASSAITAAGTMYSWGGGVNGALGSGSTTSAYTPILGDMTAVGAAAKLAFHKIQTKSIDDPNDKIGLASTGEVYLIGSTTKIDMSAYSNDKHFMDITGGAYHRCGLTAIGHAYCWGANTYGALGDGTTTDSTTPVLVDMSAYPTDSTFVKLAAGSDFTCGLTSLGNLYCWGRNNSSQLGEGTTTDSSLPVPVDVSGLPVDGGISVADRKSFIDIKLGTAFACAVNIVREAYCWGYNAFGGLGDSTTTLRATPTRIVTTSMGTDTKVLSIHPGSEHSCLLSTQGNIYCSGPSDYIGDGLSTQSSEPTPIDMSAYGTIYLKALDSSETGSCGLATDNTMYCWGTNANGQLGDGSITTAVTPIVYDMSAYASDNIFIDLSVGVDNHCAVTVEGTVYCAGADFTAPAYLPNTTVQTLP